MYIFISMHIKIKIKINRLQWEHRGGSPRPSGHRRFQQTCTEMNALSKVLYESLLESSPMCRVRCDLLPVYIYVEKCIYADICALQRHLQIFRQIDLRYICSRHQ